MQKYKYTSPEQTSDAVSGRMSSSPHKRSDKMAADDLKFQIILDLKADIVGVIRLKLKNTLTKELYKK